MSTSEPVREEGRPAPSATGTASTAPDSSASSCPSAALLPSSSVGNLRYSEKTLRSLSR
eukprot:CAMPEP_0194730462 /NCGR_PEP_ID=MMETSP0296-20130528/52846_1 /TAXON_ID=39354 /ORGANISM="Heterosigma akashiwo, Strain CCMP2393" /LENGTH=58 /DNA_ID=CAMNT_0039637533 /DNA_START=76 /DNA_END=249 /DNA_ORIENTATION=+